MKDKKYHKEEPVSDSDILKDEPSIRDVADLVLESLEEGYKTDGEPFEVYAQKLKSHIHTADQEEFKHRFTEGYDLLIEALQKPDKKSK
jgi:hypothetical protein